MKTIVPSLATLSLNKVVTEIWWNCGIIEELEKALPRLIEAPELVFLLSTKRDTLRQMEHYKEPCYKLLESVLRKVTSIGHVPQKLKTKIAMTLIKLEHDVTDFILDLQDLLKYTSRNVNNVIYCINKIWITVDCELDRSETILRILEHSFLQIELDSQIIGRYCCMRPYMLYGVQEHLEVCNRNEGEKKINEYLKHIQSNRILGLWKEEAAQHARANNGEFHPNRAQVFNYMAVNAPLDVLKYFCKRLKKVHKPIVIPTALVSLLLTKEGSAEKIVYLQSKVSQKTWLKVLVRYHENVFLILFASHYSDYCIKFFRELCDNGHLDIAKRMLFISVHMLCSPVYKTDYNVYKAAESVNSVNCQETVLSMWCHAPDSLKMTLGSDLHPSLDCLVDRNEFNILKMLINDGALSSQQKDDIRLHVASKMVLEHNLHQEDEEIMDILKNMDLEKLKRVLCAKAALPDYDWLEKKYLKSDIKQELIKDRSFIVQALSVRSLFEEENSAQDFLTWCFNGCAFSFIDKKLLSELWLVDIYKNYLLEISKSKVCPSDYLFRAFDVDHVKEAEIKKLVREDIEFINKLLGNFMVPNFCNVQALTKCLFMERETAQNKTLLHNYCISGAGLRQIRNMLETDYYNEDLYIQYGISSRVSHYAEFILSWIKPYPKSTHKVLIEKLTTILSNYSSDIVDQKISNTSKLLPSESIECNNMITEANHRIFMKMIVDSGWIYIGRYRVLDYIAEGITESLTEFINRHRL